MNGFMILSGLVMVLLVGDGWAEPSSSVAFTPEVLRTLAEGQPQKGQTLSAGCKGCHVAQGPGPLLEGQVGAYLYKQMKDYQAGHRQNELMSGLVAGLSDQDLVDLAAYFSQQEAPSSKASDASELAETLVKTGDPRRILPPCAACHERDGRGQKIDVPAIRGQSIAYLEQTLRDYKSGRRHNDLFGRMRTISGELSDTEIQAIAHYYGQ